MLMKRYFVMALAAMAIGLQSGATNSKDIYPLIQNVCGRNTQCLDGMWKYILDIYELGYYNYRMAEDPNGWFRDAHARNPEDLVEYNFDTAPTLYVLSRSR